MSLNSVLVDLASGGSPWKLAVRASSVTNITLSGLQTIDAVVLALGDRVGVFGQSNPAYNGIYIVKETAWVRAADFDRPEYVQLGSFVLVLEGTARAGHMFRLSSPTSGQISVGVTQLSFTDQGLPGAGFSTPLATPGSLAQRAAVTAACAFGPLEAPSIGGVAGELNIADDSTVTNIYGASINLGASAVNYCEDPSLVPMLTLSPNNLRLKDALSSFTIDWDQRAAGVGKLLRVKGQQGQAGFAGGTVRLEVGPGGTPGTNVPGDLTLDLGRTAGGTGGEIKFVTNTGGADAVRRHIQFLSGGVNDWTENETLDIYALALQLRSSNGVSISSSVHTGFIKHTGVITPTAIGTNQNPFNPSNLLVSRRVNQDVSAACIIQTITAGTDGQRLTLRNHSSTIANTLTLLHDDGATGTAANRIRCPNNANFVIRCNGAAELEYCGGALNRWTVIAA